MGDFLRQVFGGSQQTQQSTATSTPSNYTDPSLSGLANPLSGSLQQLLQSFNGQANNAGNPNTATSVPQAPVTGNEQNLLNTIQGQVGPGTDSANYIKNVLSGQYLPGQPGGNPFLQAAITAAQRPTLENLTQTLTRDLPGRFTQGGQFIQSNTGDQGGSSAFDRAGAIATRGAANAIGDIATNMSNTQYTNERQNQNVAAGLDQNEVNNTISALQASALPRLIQQNGITQGLALFQQQTDNLLNILKTIGTVQAPTLANTSTSQSSGQGTSEKGIFPDLFPKGV